MFIDEVRRAVATTPRKDLPRLAQALWRAYGAGGVSEADAQAIAEEIEIRKKPAAPAPRPAQRRVGSRPRTPASLERRRRCAAAGRMPPQLASRFTLGEQAALALVAAEVALRGDCRLSIGQLAALAGVCATTVRNALRAAAADGLISIEERRITAWRNDTNIVRIVSTDWTSWMRLRSEGGRMQIRAVHDYGFNLRPSTATAARPLAWRGRRSERPDRPARE